MAWILLVALTAISLGVRISNIYQRTQRFKEVPVEPIPSLFSKALTQLLGVAGGIYLVLVMMASFLSLRLPSQWSFLGIECDPLALVALLSALVQPFLERLWVRYGSS